MLLLSLLDAGTTGTYTVIFPDSAGDGAQYPVPTHKSPASELHASRSGCFLNACTGHVPMSLSGGSGRICSPFSTSCLPGYSGLQVHPIQSGQGDLEAVTSLSGY